MMPAVMCALAGMVLAFLGLALVFQTNEVARNSSKNRNLTRRREGTKKHEDEYILFFFVFLRLFVPSCLSKLTGAIRRYINRCDETGSVHPDDDHDHGIWPVVIASVQSDRESSRPVLPGGFCLEKQKNSTRRRPDAEEIVMASIKLPDGSIKEIPDGSSVQQLAESIGKGLARAAIAGKVDGKVVDLSHN
jgi:hypothetical protein